MAFLFIHESGKVDYSDWTGEKRMFDSVEEAEAHSKAKEDAYWNETRENFEFCKRIIKTWENQND